MPTNLVVRYLHGVRRVLLTFTGDDSNLNANEATARLRQFSTHSSATYENELLPIELTGAKFRPDGGSDEIA